jgi:hypothetical protein
MDLLFFPNKFGGRDPHLGTYFPLMKELFTISTPNIPREYFYKGRRCETEET